MLRVLILLTLVLSTTLCAKEYANLAEAQKAGKVQIERDFVYVTIYDTVYTEKCNCARLNSSAFSKPLPEDNSENIITSNIDNQSNSKKYYYVTMHQEYLVENCACAQPAKEQSQKSNRKHSLAIDPFGLFSTDLQLRYTYGISEHHHIVIDAGSDLAWNGGFFGAGYIYSSGNSTLNTWFLGSELGWSQVDAPVEMANTTIHLNAKELNLKLYYGKRYQWESGFFWEWRLGPAIPFYSSLKITNQYNEEQKAFDEDADLFRTIAKWSRIIAGGGLHIGWCF